MVSNFRLISQLGDSTSLYPGHEYTHSNLVWALKMDPDNKALQQMYQKTSKHPQGYHIPSTVGLEKQINLFMKCDDAEWRSKLGVNSGEAAMDKFRQMKTNKQWLS